MVSAVLFITFFVLLVLNVPISVCLGLSSAAAILYSGTSLTIVATNIYSGISKFLLLAIPFFVLSGNIMAKAGISTRLIRFVDTCVGHRKGGIANVCIIVACFFGAISGSGPATVAALGAVLIPAMIERGGFSAAFSTALMATSSSIAIVIPPSIAFVVYASITGVSIGDMFMAGIIPGILMGLALVVVVMLEVRRNHVVPSNVEKASAKERWNAFKDAFWGFLMPVIILGGIYGGLVTPTEAAVLSVLYALIYGLVTKEIKVNVLWTVLSKTVLTSAVVTFIISVAKTFGWILSKTRLPAIIGAAIMEVIPNKWVYLAVLMVLLFLVGCLMDTIPSILILAPILVPVGVQLGCNELHLGVLFCITLTVGFITPPFGINLFTAVSTTGESYTSVVKGVIPFMIVMIICVLICAFVAPIITFLPGFMMGT